jgi:hypothetical protein
VLARHPPGSAINLFGSKWWTIGWLVAVGAWLLHVGALSLASLSIVQAVISAGLVFRAILAERSFGFQLGRRQWTGLLITAVGPAILALTTHDHASSGRADRRPEHCDRDQRRADLRIDPPRACASAQGHPPGTAAGARFGTSGIAIKQRRALALNHLMLLLNP